jgi:hypothetical protein
MPLVEALAGILQDGNNARVGRTLVARGPKSLEIFCVLAPLNFLHRVDAARRQVSRCGRKYFVLARWLIAG